MPELIVHKENIPIYNGYLTFFIYDSEDDFLKYDKKNHIVGRSVLSDATAYVSESSFYNKGLHYYVIEVVFKKEYLKDVNTGVIAHEAFHVVEHIFKRMGEKNSIKASEPAAYLLGYVAERIRAFLDKNVK